MLKSSTTMELFVLKSNTTMELLVFKSTTTMELFVLKCATTMESPRVHLLVVGMLWFMSQT